MTRPAWQRRPSLPAKTLRARQEANDMHTALIMLSMGAVSTVDGEWTRLDVPCNGATAKIPTETVNAALAEIAAGDVVGA